MRMSLSESNLVAPSLAAEAAAAGGVEPLLEQFLPPILALAGAQAGAVRVLTDDGQSLRLVAQQGLPAFVLMSERLVEHDCGACGSAAGSDSLRWVDDVGSCAKLGAASYFGPQCKRVLAISLAHGGQMLGTYSLFFETDARLEPPTETILRLVGQLLGLALHNSRIERERLRVTVLRERQEMVNEVHDAIAQTLAYVRMRLPLLNDAMLAHDDQRSQKYFGDVKQAVGEVHDNLREVMTFFRTRMDPLGLLHALHDLADGFVDRTGITLEVRELAKNLDLSDQQEIQVFHIAQEALANIAKHSGAKHAVLTIDKAPDQIEMTIEDDGSGMDPRLNAARKAGSDQSPHLGLEIMQGRAKRLGGSIAFRAMDGGGTCVRLVVPLAPPQGAFA